MKTHIFLIDYKYMSGMYLHVVVPSTKHLLLSALFLHMWRQLAASRVPNFSLIWVVILTWEDLHMNFPSQEPIFPIIPTLHEYHVYIYGLSHMPQVCHDLFAKSVSIALCCILLLLLNTFSTSAMCQNIFAIFRLSFRIFHSGLITISYFSMIAC